jgi:hypothetical protein
MLLYCHVFCLLQVASLHESVGCRVVCAKAPRRRPHNKPHASTTFDRLCINDKSKFPLASTLFNQTRTSVASAQYSFTNIAFNSSARSCGAMVQRLFEYQHRRRPIGSETIQKLSVNRWENIREADVCHSVTLSTQTPLVVIGVVYHGTHPGTGTSMLLLVERIQLFVGKNVEIEREILREMRERERRERSISETAFFRDQKEPVH